MLNNIREALLIWQTARTLRRLERRIPSPAFCGSTMERWT